MRAALQLLLLAAISAGLLVAWGTRLGPVPPLATLLDPVDGVSRTARRADPPRDSRLTMDALDGPVTVVRDDRSVPHVFAESDHDALVAFGYLSAQDRLFQMDFLRRAASGRLSEVMGPAALRTDRFMRATGLELGVQRTSAWLRDEGFDAREAIEAYQAGVNAYVASLEAEDLPFEYRLLGFEPEPFVLEDAIRLLQFMAFDLTFRSDAAAYGILFEALGEAEFFNLFPRHSRFSVPIIQRSAGPGFSDGFTPSFPLGSDPVAVASANDFIPRHPVAEGYRHGKGSNSWGVRGERSATGMPILSGDVHLGLTLPSIWYEVHLSTPTMNVYGVSIPGAPLPVIGFNDHVAWTFTNSGADQVDYLLLTIDSTRTRYRTEAGWRDFSMATDTIRIRGAEPVIDTVRISQWGPVEMLGEDALTFQWTAHFASRTVASLWDIVHAHSVEELDDALRQWDTPMQNVLYADVHGNLAMRVAGLLPVRRGGHGMGVARAETGAFDWTGFVPFEEMPHEQNPPRNYLASANQQPVDSTYRYYLGYDWRDAYRAVRIDELLRQKATHSVEDIRSYQSDVMVVQHRLFLPLLDTLQSLSAGGERIREELRSWDGRASVDASAPLVLDEFLLSLQRLAWDEPVFAGSTPDRVTRLTFSRMRNGRTVSGPVPTPTNTTLLRLLTDHPRSPWLDVTSTPEREDAAGLLRAALEATADTMTSRYGEDAADWEWGTHHSLMIPHLTRSSALRALWRGPYAYPGFASTLSPAGDRMATHSAAWRMIVDFSSSPPSGFGVLPGGQSGNPFSTFYAHDVQRYLSFELNPLLKPASPDGIPTAATTATMHLVPSAASRSSAGTGDVSDHPSN